MTPLEVYRVFVDGRAGSVGAGCGFDRYPVVHVLQYRGCGDKPAFSRAFAARSRDGARDGILTHDIREQDRNATSAQARDIASILPSPKPEVVKENNPDDVIFAAMRSEQERNKAALVLPNGPKPYYISYTIARYRPFSRRPSVGRINAFERVPVANEWWHAGVAW